MKYLLLIIVFVLASEVSSLACSCIPPKSPREELGQSAAVFSGKVVKIERAEQKEDLFTEVEAFFEVERVWKGIDKPKVSVFTSSHSAACGYGFKSGEEYLVYASENGKGQLVTTICSRTKTMKDAKDDIKELGDAKSMSSKAKAIHGIEYRAPMLKGEKTNEEGWYRAGMFPVDPMHELWASPGI